MADADAQRKWRRKAKRKRRGDMELSHWLTRDQRRAFIAARLIHPDDIDDPEEIGRAIDFVVAGLAKIKRGKA